METIEIATNIEELNEKIRALKKPLKDINNFEFKGTFKKEGEIHEYSTNLGDISELLNRLEKLIKEINNFKIKATTKKIKAT